MPRPQRTEEEIEQVKTRILETAARLMADTGYDGFTMRTLATGLGVTATTIYNYYRNKDDLFLNLLILGFSDLGTALETALEMHATPADRLKAMIRAYTDFGLDNANFYNLMYTLHVPKYNTYAGTAMEPVARRQLEIALKIPDMFISCIRSYAKALDSPITEDQAVFLLIHYWSQVHGFIAGCHNTNLSYIHKDPLSLKDQHLNGIAIKFKTDVLQLGTKGEL